MSYEKYDPYLALLEFKDVSPLEAERIAEKCFHAQSWIVKDLSDAEYKELLLSDNNSIVESELLLTTPDNLTNAPARQAWVVTRPARKEIYERYAKSKVNTEYLKRLFRLFESAQIYYGNKARR
jgi:hypothetical protein